jgi:hypothetical protein
VILRVGTVNVGTMHARSAEVSEMLKHRKLDFCCFAGNKVEGWKCQADRKLQVLLGG